MARGMKTGGRTTGTLNKATLERAKLAEQVIHRASMTGEKLAKEQLADIVVAFVDMAKIANPLLGLREMPAKRPKINKDEFERWGTLAMNAAKELAKYQSPQFRAIQVSTPGNQTEQPAGGMKQIEGNVVPLNDPVGAARLYRRIVTAGGKR